MAGILVVLCSVSIGDAADREDNVGDQGQVVANGQLSGRSP